MEGQLAGKDVTGRPGDIIDVVKVADTEVMFADADALCGEAVPVTALSSGAASASAGGTGVAELLVKRKGVRVYDVDVDALLGPSYDSAVRRPLRDWTHSPAPPPMMPDSAERSSGDASSSSASSTGELGADEEVYLTPSRTTSNDDADAAEEDCDTGAPLGIRIRRRHRSGQRQAGKGRGRGLARDVRESLTDILVVLFCRQMAAALDLHDAGDGNSERLLRWTVNRLRSKRASYKDLSNTWLSTKAWSLRRSGCVGAVLQFKDKGALDNIARDNSIAFEVSLSASDDVVVCCSRAAEDCLGAGCVHRDAVVNALQVVRECSKMSTVDVLGVLSEDLRVSAMNQGIAVLYGKRLCVVRREGGSWPFAVVRRKRNGMWLCHACTQGPSSCTHAMAARDAGSNQQSEASGDESLMHGLGRPGRRRGNLVYSTSERPLVPSQRSQAQHAKFIEAATMGKKVDIPAPKTCPTCSRLRPSNVPVTVGKGSVEFGTGAVSSAVKSWWCHRCKRTCVVDGLEEGLVMCSQFTAYSEVFLFEAAVNLCRNASSLTSTYDLRSSFHQLSKEHTLPLSIDNLRSLPLFRSTVLLYIYLVIQGLPGAVSTCAICARPDGSMRFICFDGLQLGFKMRYRTGFERISIKLMPIQRASIIAQIISDASVARALGSVVSVSTTEHESARQKAVQTLTAVRGHLIALAVLDGDVKVLGEADNLAGATPHASGPSRSRGWDPVVDGGVHPAVIDFIRELFLCGRAARKVALTVAGASDKLRRKVPSVLMDRVNAVIARGTGDQGSESDDGGVDEQRSLHNLSAAARAVGDPGLLDAGGAAGQARRDGALMRIIPAIPSTAATTAHLVDFVRAVVVDPVVVWAPGGNWEGVHALVTALAAEPFDQSALAAASKGENVKSQRLLHGAVAALYPVLCSQPRVRDLFTNLLLAICETNERYLAFVKADAVEKLPAAGDQLLVATVEEMAANGETKVYHPVEYTKRWLDVAASVERFRAVYGRRAEAALDFLRSGQWAPSFPIVRPIPDFLAIRGVAEDLPECNHLMGEENQFTGGTFSASCTCSHPKTIGVVVLDGSEGQRMPIEFVAQRMPTMPDRVIYDFSCASLKTSLARLPYFALFVSWLVDRFHWFKNHVWCSKAMNPDSYVSVDGLNTSASEERNAASRRLQNFLRLVNQRNFILFTVYQQAVGNVIAMHRDVHTPKMVDRWPLWYRKKYVDIVDERRPADVARVNNEGGVGEAAGHSEQGEETRDAREGEEEDLVGEAREAYDGGRGDEADFAELGEDTDVAGVGDEVDDGGIGGETDDAGEGEEVDDGGQWGEAQGGGEGREADDGGGGEEADIAEQGEETDGAWEGDVVDDGGHGGEAHGGGEGEDAGDGGGGEQTGGRGGGRGRG